MSRASLLLISIVTLVGCDLTSDAPLSDDTFRMRLDSREFTGRAAFEENGGIRGEAEVVLNAETGTLRIRSDSFLAPRSGESFTPSVGSYYSQSQGLQAYYSFEDGDVRATDVSDGAITGEFDLVLVATVAFVLKDRVRASGRFRVTRPAPTAAPPDGGRR